jgi:2-C-methyl-D-erythritol 4-phosphate cytidylyltransferase/2-C-methyl-D-erythritol 2,4-cyclodiphosphate synthase
VNEQAEKVVCLVAAAGRGVRFGREVPKSFYPVAGHTLLTRSLRSLGAWGGISSFIVMVPDGWQEKAEADIGGGVPELAVKVLAGGETRQESVAKGLESIEEAGLVLVHDACRPLVSITLVERVAAAAAKYGAAVPVLQVTDTLGRLRDEALEGIVPRDRVVGIQTPQAFKLEVLRRAFEAADDMQLTSTDESSLVMAAGFPVRVVEGERWNIKVTVKDDLEIIASFLEGKRIDLPGKGS